MSEELLYTHPAPVKPEPETIPPSDEMLPSSRVPHLGHAILFLSFGWLVTKLVFTFAVEFTHNEANQPLPPKPQLAAQIATYLVVLASSFLTFPLLWGRGFLAGINWNGRHALRLAIRLISLGLCVGWTVQALSSLIAVPKSMPIDNFFRHPSDVWLVAGFGTLLAPLFEEITFRGFLLPAIAIAFDWLRPVLRHVTLFSVAWFRGAAPERHIAFFRETASAGLAENTGNLFYRSRAAMVLASLLTSGMFAMLHADQLAHASGALYILFCVSLVLTGVRVQTRSVACSTLVHASYNLSVFITLFAGTGGFRHLEKLTH